MNLQTILNRVAKLEMQMKGVQDESSQNATRVAIVESERSGPVYFNVVSGGVSIPWVAFSDPLTMRLPMAQCPQKGLHRI